MTFDQAIRLLETIAHLLGAVAWPSVALIAAWKIIPAVLRTMSDSDDFSVDIFGFKAAFAKKKSLAVAALANAARDVVDGQPQADSPASAKDVVAQAVTPTSIKKLEGRKILWADDRPSNNSSARQAFEALGIKFDFALDTDEAIRLLAQQHFDLVISDMGRPPDSQAGYTLLDRLRSTGNSIPFVIYSAGGSDLESRAKARRHGALDSTNSSNDLFQIVTAQLTR